MSTHANPESRAESSVEPTVEPDPKSNRESDPSAEPAVDPFETHNAAATFGASDRRLPNTVDSENKYLG